MSSRFVFTGLLAVNILSAVLHAWAVMQWSWFQDDWLYIQRAASWSLDDYLLMNYNGHAMPLKFFIVWILTSLAPLDFAPAGALLVALIVASGVTWTTLLVKIFGLKVQVLFAVTALVLSPLFLSPTLWWAAGMQTYSLQLGMALALWGALAYLQDQRRSMFLLSIGAFIASVLTWEKALLIAIPVAFLVLLLPGVDRSLRTTWISARRLLVAYVSIGAALALLFLWITRNPVPGQADLSVPPIGMLLSFVFTAAFGLTMPALAGGPWAGIPGLTSVFPSISMLWEWLFVAGASLLAAWGLVFRRMGWAAIAMAVTFGFVSWGLVVGSSRYVSLGEFAALDPRYSADVAVVIIFASVYLVTSTRRESSDGSAWRFRVPAPIPRIAAVSLVAGATLVTISSLATWSTMMHSLLPLSPRPWVDNLTETARSIGPQSVFDSNAPINVLYPYYYPDEGRLSAMLAPLSLALEFDAPADRMFAATADGKLVPAMLDVRSVAEVGQGGECGYLVNSDQWTYVPMSSALYAWNWGIRLSYFSQGEPEFEVRALDDSFTFRAPSGVGELSAVVVSEIDVIALRTLNGVTACVPTVVVGLVEPIEET